jgi:hypothetical protein
VQFGAGDSLTGILGYYYNPYYKTDLLATIIGNLKGLFADSSTLYTLFLLTVWTAGLWVRKRFAEKISAAEIAGFIFSVLILLAFLRSEGWYRYLFEAQIVSLIFFPYSLYRLVRPILARFKFRGVRFAPVAMIVLLSLLGLYQLSFRSWVADAYSSRKTAFWQEYFEDVPPSTSILFHNVPEVAPFVRHRNYYQYISCAGGVFGVEQLEQIGKVGMIVMRSDTYEADPKAFDAYKVADSVYKYTVLTKK